MMSRDPSKKKKNRDVKPENVLMMSSDPSEPLYYHVKLTDFGLSSDAAKGYNDVMRTGCGTPDFTGTCEK